MTLVRGLFALRGGKVYAEEVENVEKVRLNLIIDEFVAAFGEKRQIFDVVVEIVADFFFGNGKILFYFRNVEE